MDNLVAGQSAKVTFSSEESVAKRRLEQLLNQCSYEKLLKVALMAPSPVLVIEESLRAALKLGRGERIIKLYRYLSKINSEKASLFSEDVAPFFEVVNKKAKITSCGQFSPGRQIWNIPARMRKPIYKKTVC